MTPLAILTAPIGDPLAAPLLAQSHGLSDEMLTAEPLIHLELSGDEMQHVASRHPNGVHAPHFPTRQVAWSAPKRGLA